jgi:peptidoglycan/LPS O-acetylase OafA/YrhL
MSDAAAPRLRHLPALDGLRGLAVLAVVLFHANWLTGGWVGVDVFFVLSGYLITRLLLIERAKGRISLRAFWGRRFRRLMPALLSLVLVVSFAERWRRRLSGPAGARWDITGALTYLSNWFRLRDGVGYWSNFGGVSLLDHVWSLAIEEQFYVVWPLVIVAVTWRASQVPSRLLVAGLSVAAVLLGAWSLWWFARTGDANRVYLGTDTRAVAIVLGAAAGAMHQLRGDQRSRVEHLAGAVGAVFLVWACIDLGGLEQRTYRGGLLLCSVSATAVIWATSGSHNRVASMLGAQPLSWLGARSYGIYLWHWPVMVGLRVAKNESSSNMTRLLALAVTAVVAEGSFRLIEMPFRRRGLSVLGGRRRLVVGLGGLVVATSIVAVALPLKSTTVVTAAAQGEPLVIPTVVAQPDEPTPVIPQPEGAAQPWAGPVELPAGRPARVFIAGDSVGWFFGKTLHETQASLGLEVEAQAVPSCPPTSIDVPQRVGEGGVVSHFEQACRDKVENYRSDVARFAPDVVLVMFGGALFSEYEVSPGVWSDACGAPFGPWFIDQVTSVIKDLGSGGAPVMIVTEANYREPSVPDDYPEIDKLTVCKNKLWLEVVDVAAAQGQLVGLVPLGEWVCPVPGRCLDQRQGVELRPDGVHLRDWSAILAWQWMAPQLFDPAPKINQG